MPVKHFELSTIDARRFAKSNEKHPNIQISVNHAVILVKEMNETQVNIEFRFSVNYTGMGALGAIKLEGFLIFEGDAKGIVTTWQEEKKLPDDMAPEALTFIMNNCLIESVMIARDIRLPPPLQMPQVKVGQGPQKVAPSDGIEVA